ncbi:hypothetical protein [Acinetobacter pittii]|uniref:hypothetical protein n=1 Tax=Acinetobacter pittii TaxID=48296 RepID=UPI0024696389|nr:hypothetical protein [Acinetobacter pittii]WGM25430.1 hypothetical protein OFU58_03780 [Acinetobacter pittii]
MKPEQFIRDFGVEKAKKVLGQSPALKCYYLPKYEQYFTDKHGFIYVLGMFGYFTPTLDMTMDDLTSNGFLISDLKQLVASLKLIESKGGIENVKEDELWANELGFGYKDLAQAIKDHESIYGGGDES